MIDLLRLCRLYYVLPLSSILPLTIAYARGAEMSGHWRGAAFATAALILIMAGGFVLNDVCDVAADRINAPDRPVAAGRVSRGTAIAWGVMLLTAGLSIAALCRPAYLALLAGVTAAIVVYDITSKRLGWLKPVWVAVLVTSVYPLAWAEAGGTPGRRAATLVVFPIWLCLTTFGYEVLKDLRDVVGDAAADRRLNDIQRNPRRALTIARTALAVGGLVLAGPALLGCGWVYLGIVWTAMALGLACVALSRPAAMAVVYAECVVVGISAVADVLVLGA